MRTYVHALVVALALSPACSTPAPQQRPDPKFQSSENKAKNVILLLADAAGIPTLSAASLAGYGKPLSLNVQGWPNIGLSETSTADEWVTDSAAGMTAIVTGTKTRTGVLSQAPDAERGEQNGMTLTTILERAEERGLSTGVISSQPVADATPAACYAHSSDRDAAPAELLAQAFQPRFGDGVDVLMGIGRTAIEKSTRETGVDPYRIAAAHGRRIYSLLRSVPASERRPVVVAEGDIDVPAATRMAIRTLAKNPKGYFLMVEWDSHTFDVERGLQHVVAFDKLARDIAASVNLRDTLVLFTADHSFDLRVVGGARGTSLLTGLKELHRAEGDESPLILPAVEVTDRHTGEEVVVAGIGARSAQVHGFFPNTHLYQIMMNAFGWDETESASVTPPSARGSAAAH